MQEYLWPANLPHCNTKFKICNHIIFGPTHVVKIERMYLDDRHPRLLVLVTKSRPATDAFIIT